MNDSIIFKGTAQLNGGDKLTAATIVFFDLVGFSKKPTAKQRQLINSLTTEVIHEIRHVLHPPMDQKHIVALPTGDGMALAFLHSPNRIWDIKTLLKLIIRIQKWADVENTNEETVSLCIGVHVGPIEFITDINGKRNICGDTINYAQRVMSAANPKQILFSDAAFREYIGSEDPKVKIKNKKIITIYFKGPIEVHAKHGRHILVYKLVIKPKVEWWFDEDPVSKNLMLVRTTELPKEIIGTFSEKIENATYIALIQLTGDRFLKSYKKGDLKLSKKLKRFWVFMPDPKILNNQIPIPPLVNQSEINEYISIWKDFFFKLKEEKPDCDLKIGIFFACPFYGASFIDWERPGGRIHISPYVWNIPAPDCPGYDLEWLGKNPSPIYEKYLDGLNYINSSTKNILNE